MKIFSKYSQKYSQICKQVTFELNTSQVNQVQQCQLKNKTILEDAVKAAVAGEPTNTKVHLKDGTIGSYTKEKYDNPKMEYWLSQSEFCDEFPLSVFRNKIQQEEQTAKYHHTLTVRRKKETYKYSN